jgi:hypothetical protein
LPWIAGIPSANAESFLASGAKVLCASNLKGKTDQQIAELLAKAKQARVGRIHHS